MLFMAERTWCRLRMLKDEPEGSMFDPVKKKRIPPKITSPFPDPVSFENSENRKIVFVLYELWLLIAILILMLFGKNINGGVRSNSDDYFPALRFKFLFSFYCNSITFYTFQCLSLLIAA